MDFKLHSKSCNGFKNGLPTVNDHQDKLEPIAIIGQAVKFPQDATSQESFWQLLLHGRSAITEVPKNRFNIDAYYHTNKEHHGTMNTRKGHFMKEDIDCFDAPFFSMSPMEAKSLDPQQRCLLETTYQALENAGIPLEKVTGSRTSVHIGSFLHEHELLVDRDPEMHVGYKNTGVSQSLLANRLSWFYNFIGPSITLDTACSSTLHAVHLACQSLRLRESTMGIVGGSNIIYDPQSMVAMADQGLLSPDGTCYTFDSRANGYSRGEGVAVIVLKLLSQALQDGDAIRAVIRATGLNQDGRTTGGITQPNPIAQEDLIREVYASGGLAMAKTRYFEAHGTGTPLGDLIEISALGAAFKDVKENEPLIVGAVKTNIGHLEATSGLAGLIKTVLILENGIIPPNINFASQNPNIKADECNIQFPLNVMPWPAQGLRRASVNSFGFGGANAHIVLDDAYHYLRNRKLVGRHTTRINIGVCQQPPEVLEQLIRGKDSYPRATTDQPFLFVWSAADEDGILRITSTYGAYLENINMVERTKSLFSDLAYTLSQRRTHLPWRSCAIARSFDELQFNIKQASSAAVILPKDNKLALIFTGQGAQWYAMGRDLFVYPEFRASIKASEQALVELNCNWSLQSELLKDKDVSRVDQPELSQPICVALQLALVDLLQSWKLQPMAVVGHSSGEIAAAYCTGAISAQSAMKIAYYRGLMVSALRGLQTQECGMMAVGLSLTEVQQYIDQVPRAISDGSISVACINSPHNVTLSGSAKLLDVVKVLLDHDNIFTRKVNVDMAYHSIYMDAGASEYKVQLGFLASGLKKDHTPTMISSLTGKAVSHSKLQSAEYWVQNMVNKVNFLGAVSYMCSPSFATNPGWLDGTQVDYFLEVGPHSAMRSALRDILKEFRPQYPLQYFSLLSREQPALNTALEAIGKLYCLGFPMDLHQINNFDSIGEVGLLTNLPPYPFNRSKRYWKESQLSKNTRFREFPRHELLGSPVPDWNPSEAKWRNLIRPGENPWIAGHVVNGLDVCPAASMLIMALEAARQVSKSRDRIKGYRFREVTFAKSLNVDPEGPNPEVEIEFHLRRGQDSTDKLPSWSAFALYMLDHEEWVQCCNGSISLDYYDEEIAMPGQTSQVVAMNGEMESKRNETFERFDVCKQSLDSKSVYDYFDGMGLEYGLVFQALRNIQYNNDGMIKATADLHHWKEHLPGSNLVPHVIHPATLDVVFQLMIPIISRGCQNKTPTLVPTRLDNLWISDLLRAPRDTQIQIYTEASLEGLRNAKACSTAVLATSGIPCISGSWHTTAVTATGSATQRDRQKKRLAYLVDTRPDVDLLDNGSIQRWCVTGKDLYRPDDLVVKKKKELCYLAMLDIIESFKIDDLNLGKPELGRYLEWIRSSVSSTESTTAPAWMGHKRGDDYFLKLLEEVSGADVEGKLLAQVARGLPQIFSGELNALELLFSNGLLEDFYREGLGVQTIFNQVALYIDALAHKNPDLQILEVGAGIGTATGHLLESLVNHPGQRSGGFRFANYCYTDISPAFLGHGKEKFSEYERAGHMTFLVLDIEKDPLEQGFTAAKYDLVVALNVIHATSSVLKSLGNTRKLLKPGGRILLIELTGEDMMQQEFVFGLLPGWWLSLEEQRKNGPLMLDQEWEAHLKEAGFSGVDAVFRNHSERKYHTYSAIIATAAGTPQKKISLGDAFIVVNEDSPSQIQLAETLQGYYDSASNCEIIPFQNMAVEGIGAFHYVFLTEIDKPFIYRLSDNDFIRLQKMFSSAKSILWVSNSITADPLNNLINGLQRTYRIENESVLFATLFFSDGGARSWTPSNIFGIWKNMQNKPAALQEAEYLEQNGLIYINRVVESTALNERIASAGCDQAAQLYQLGRNPSRPLAIGLASPGLLNTFQFSDDLDAQQDLEPREIEIGIKYTGINFRDLLTALGQTDNTILGLEGTGYVARAGKQSGFVVGDRVCALLLGAHRTHARCDSRLACRIPDNMDLQSAAAMPIVFCTAYHALMNIARLSPGQSILIHSGAGGLGQAAIQLAQLIGAEIFATVGTDNKRQMLIDQYNIKPNQIFSSRSVSFSVEIKRLTHERGVDVVVNSLAGEGLRASWECIAPFGCFIEVGRKDIDSFGLLPMASFGDNTTFASVNLVSIMRRKPDLAAQLMESVFKMAASTKIFAPRPLQVYRISQIEDAFRLMQSGKNCGKMVFEFREDDIIPVLPSSSPKCALKLDASYLIAGGLGGLGRTVARWMSTRGAKNLILLTSSKKDNEETAQFLEEMESAGVVVAVLICDIRDQKSVQSAVDKCSKTMPPIKGCIQAAMILKDAKFDSISKADFDMALGPKIDGSWNLHSSLSRNLDFFIMFSSLAGVAPSFGQSNYAAGNSYQDALAQYRTTRGEKAVSFDLGMVIDAGFVAQHNGMAERLAARGATPVYVEDILSLLEYYCDASTPISRPVESQVIIGLQTRGALRDQGIEEPYWLQRPLFNYLRCIKEITGNKDNNRSTISLETLLQTANSLDQATDLICKALARKLAKILVMEAEDIHVDKPVYMHGADSLVAMELRQWFRIVAQADIATFEILGSSPIIELANKAAIKSKLVRVDKVSKT